MKSIKHNTVVDHTPAGTPVVYVEGIWGSGRCLQGHTEDHNVHVSIGDNDGENDFHTLEVDAKHNVCVADADGFFAWSTVVGREAAYRRADEMLQRYNEGTLNAGKN